MATLQKLRNMGPLLVIFVGLALFAFIAGDAWRLFQTDSMEASVGTLNEESLSAVDFETIYKECENAQKMFKLSDPRLTEEQKNASFGEEEMALIKEEAWNIFIQSAIAQKQAKELGITVTNEEIMDILNNNSSQYLNSIYHPFRTQNGFSTDDLNSIITSYNQMLENGQYDANLATLYSCWEYMKKRVVLEAIIKKQVRLLEAATIVNPVLAQKNFDLNNNTYNVEVVSFPYSNVADSLVAVSEKEINNYYKENKKYLYEQANDSRDIKYITVKVTPSETDKSDLLAQMNEVADTLKAGSTDFERISRIARNEYNYNDLLWTKEAFSEDVQIRIEAAKVNEVVGPYLNPSDNSYNIFMTTSKTVAPDSMLIRAIVVNSQSADEVTATTDSLMNELKKKGSNFKEIAKNYPNVDSLWITSKEFYTAGLIDNVNTQKEIYNARPGVYAASDFKTIPGKLIYQVISKKGKADVYSTAIIKRTIEFSSETYDKAYNKFSQFIASCKNIEEVEAKAMENGYRVQKLNDVNASTKNIGNIPQTGNLIKWVLNEERKAGDFSLIEECNSENLVFAVVTSINSKGYVSLDKEINNYGTKVSDLIKNQLTIDKKAAHIAAELAGQNYEEIKANSNAKVATVNMVEYKKDTYIASLNADEPVISAVAAQLNEGEVSAPVKGQSGMYVVKVLSKSSKGGSFDAASEKEYILSNGGLYSYAGIIEQIYQMSLQQVYPVENKLYRFF